MNNGSQKAKNKYLKEKVDSFVLRVPKGEKEAIQSHANKLGKSLNGYILDLIKADMPDLSTFDAKVVAPKETESKPDAPARRSSLPSFLD